MACLAFFSCIRAGAWAGATSCANFRFEDGDEKSKVCRICILSWSSEKHFPWEYRFASPAESLRQTSLLFYPQCWGIVYFTARTARCLRRGSLTPDDDDDDSLAPVCPCCNSRLIAPTKEIDQNVIGFLSFLRKRPLSCAVSGKPADCSPQLRTCIEVFACLFVCFYSVTILIAGILLSEVCQVQGTED